MRAAELRSTPGFVAACAGVVAAGGRVRFRAAGWSMYPAIQDGDVVEVAPVDPADVRGGDVLLCRLAGTAVAHRVLDIDAAAGVVTLRGDASFAPDVPVPVGAIVGRVAVVVRHGARRRLDTLPARLAARLSVPVWRAKRRLAERLATSD
jgi:signal peptidase I